MSSSVFTVRKKEDLKNCKFHLTCIPVNLVKQIILESFFRHMKYIKVIGSRQDESSLEGHIMPDQAGSLTSLVDDRRARDSVYLTLARFLAHITYPQINSLNTG